jgi:Cu-processing system permease protein
MTTLALHTTTQIFQHELRDVARSKWVVAYALGFGLVTDLLFRFGGGSAQVLLSLLNVVLILIPLVSLVFGTMYLYHAREFTQLMLSQPVRRGSLFGGLYLGLALPLAAGFALGVGLPFLWHGVEAASHLGLLALMTGAGVLLTFIFVALAFVVALRFEDRAKGLGVALLAWLLLAVIYDGLVLAVVHIFAAYPLEQPMLVLALLNPVDLARVALLLHLDHAALMGYTGAVFARFFGSTAGTGLALGALTLWLIVPLGLGLRRFQRKDF